MVGELEIRTGVCLGNATFRNFAGFLPLTPPSLMETLRDILSTDVSSNPFLGLDFRSDNEMYPHLLFVRACCLSLALTWACC